MAVGIALSGGGSQGDFEVGALTYLYTFLGPRSEELRVVTGTSVGAVNSLALAEGIGGVDHLAAIWGTLRRNSNMYVENAYLSNLDPMLLSILNSFIQRGSADLDEVEDQLEHDVLDQAMTLLGNAPGFFTAGPEVGTFMLLFLGVQTAKSDRQALVDAVTRDWDVLTSAPAVFDLQPIRTMLQAEIDQWWLVLDPASRKSITVGTDAAGNLSLIVRDPETTKLLVLDESDWLANHSTWTPLPGPASAIRSRAAIAQSSRFGETLALKASDGSIWVAKESDGGSWQAINPASGLMFKSNPALVAGADGSLYLAAITAQEGLWVSALRVGDTKWLPWSEMDMTASENISGAIGDPVLSVDGTGTVGLFVLPSPTNFGNVSGSSGPLQFRELDATKQDFGSDSWFDLALVATSNPFVIVGEEGTFEVFLRTKSKTVARRRRLMDGSWATDWEDLGGNLASDVAAVLNADGSVDVFGRGPDNRLWHTWENSPGGAMQAWVPVTELTVTGDPVCSIDSSGTLHVFAKSLQDTVMHFVQVSRSESWTFNALGQEVWPGIKLRVATVQYESGQLRYVDENGQFLDPQKDGTFTYSPDDDAVNVANAAIASSAIPSIFPSEALNGLHYMDGGIREGIPIAAAVAAGADEIYAIVAGLSPILTLPYTPNVVNNGLRAVPDLMPDEMVRKDLYPPVPWAKIGVSVTVIAPTYHVHSSMFVDPGEIRISMDYGWMRANDVLGPRDVSSIMRRVENDRTSSQSFTERVKHFGSAPTPTGSSHTLVRRQSNVQTNTRLAPTTIGEITVDPRVDPNPSAAAALQATLEQNSDEITKTRQDAWENEATANGIGSNGSPVQMPASVTANAWHQLRNDKRYLKTLVATRLRLGGKVPLGYENWWKAWELHDWSPATLSPWDEYEIIVSTQYGPRNEGTILAESSP